MYTFFTRNAAYRVANGRITRYAVHTRTSTPNAYHLPEDSPVPSANGGESVVLNGASFGWDVPPVVGRIAVFTVKGQNEAIRTSLVKEIVRD